MFNKYYSNVSCGTGNNFILIFGENKRIVARSYFMPERTGEYNYRFFFQNTVNTTFAQGEIAYVNMSGGNWHICSARVGIGAEHGNTDVDISFTPVYFDGKSERDVLPDETFFSDEIRIDVPDNRYLVWEWEIQTLYV